MAGKVSFRCSTCGYLEASDHAAEAVVPHACRVCGDGVRFCPRRGTKSLAPEVWEKLWEATDERLAELGLSREQVEAHEPWPAGATSAAPRHVSVHVGEGVSGAQEAASQGPMA